MPRARGDCRNQTTKSKIKITAGFVEKGRTRSVALVRQGAGGVRRLATAGDLYVVLPFREPHVFSRREARFFSNATDQPLARAALGEKSEVPTPDRGRQAAAMLKVPRPVRIRQVFRLRTGQGH